MTQTIIQPPVFSIPKENFAKELRSRVNEYFHTSGIKKSGGKKIVIKATILMVIFFINYFLWIYPDFSLLIKIPLSISLGLMTALIGFNVMHDGAHQSFSQNGLLNSLAGYTLNVLGANVFFWKTKHNIVHHTYTNIPDVDDDLEAGVFLHLNPNKKHYRFHRYQHLYFPLVYSWLYLYWVFYADYKKYFTLKVTSIPIRDFNKKEKFIFWITKIMHLIIFVLIPAYTCGFSTWIVMFLAYAFSTGLILSIVFQLAHVVEEAEFPLPDEKNCMEDEWIRHQLKTTANFAMKNRFLSVLLGGLNYQIEHHLFPNISHIHYPNLSPIVQEICLKHKAPYHSLSLLDAIRSHYKQLRKLGNKN